MTHGLFQFNNSITNEIFNFIGSDSDLLFISGSKGTAKSETIASMLPELKEKNLIFLTFCFKNISINDFLLNFYDEFRNFSLAKNISLKKLTTDNFQDKVSHYFKTIGMPCIIIIENFECIEDNSEVINFIAHIATYENVKIIVTSRIQEKNIFRYRKIKVRNYEVQGLSKEEFKETLTVLSKPMEEEFSEKFYELINGFELYLKMSLKYSTIAGVELDDLADEYKRKNVLTQETYEEFLISKFLSIIPSMYLSLFKILCLFSHPVSKNFILNYSFGKAEYIDYLSNNYLIAHFDNEFLVKDYFKNYIIPTISIKEKIAYCENIIQAYETELTKSPKDRLLRLSRESIRKEIENINHIMPTISNSSKVNKNIPYLGSTNWNKNNEQKSKLIEKLDKIKERKKFLSNQTITVHKQTAQEKLIQEEKEKNTQFIINLINNARELTKKYKYNDSISELIRAQEADKDECFKVEILLLLAKNYKILNNFDFEQKCYIEAHKTCIATKDIRKCEIELLIADTNKRMFKINVARTQFEQIAYDESNGITNRTKAFIELGDINEANSNVKEAIKQYERALNLSIGKNKQLVCNIYYRLALLYDENQDTENAIKYYQKNYLTSSEYRENKYYSISLVNLALIYSEMSKYKEASEFLKLALQFNNENNDLNNVYFTQKELANLYTHLDENNAIVYYQHALDTARILKDDFKEALVYFEMGELYYDKQDDKKALINFISAKNVLKESSNKENIERIALRIRDIEVRLDKEIFNSIMDKYDKKQ